MSHHYVPLSSSIAADLRVPRLALDIGKALGTSWRWLTQHRELIWIGLILSIAGAAHGINMFNLPYYENDEGTYMSQAWSVLAQGQLAPYTYWYDHAPLGWIQIAVWTMLTGGVGTFGPTVDSGRILMLLMQIGSTAMVYLIGRRVSGSVFVASLAALAFALSAWGIYYHRRVLLDNIATFWMLASITVLTVERPSLRRVWLSAVFLGVSVLSKEVTSFLIPALGYFVYHKTVPEQRGFAVSTWFAIVFSVVSMYFLMATLKGELFPPGHAWYEGSNPHTSLLGALNYQGSRGRDGGIRNGSSAFWTWMGHWVRSEPLLLVGGSTGALVSTLRLRSQRTVGILGLLNLSLFAFLARGGEVLGFYLIPLLPLLALNLALSLDLLAHLAVRVCRAIPLPGRLLPRVAGLVAPTALAAACVPFSLAAYHTTELSFSSDPMQLWTSSQAEGQVQAMTWVRAHIPTNKCVIVDDYMWTDLATGANGPRYSCMHWYWKIDLDPAIQGPVFHHRWQTVDYLVATEQMYGDARLQGETLSVLNGALSHAVRIKHFDTGGWPIDILRVVKIAPMAVEAPGKPASADRLLPALAQNPPAPQQPAIAANPPQAFQGIISTSPGMSGPNAPRYPVLPGPRRGV